MTEILFAGALWLIITIASPKKVRIFISFLSASLIVILLFFSLLGPKGDLTVSVPSFGDQEGYELPYNEYKALVTPPVITGVVAVPNAKDLSQLGKDILINKDLSADQIKSLEGIPGIEDFKSGRTGIILRYVPPTVQNGHLVPGYDGIEFTHLPYYDELKTKENQLKTKESVLDAIRQIVNESPSQL
jgi:hypothetical protein